MEADFWLQTWENGLLGFHQNNVNTLLLRYWPEMNLSNGEVFVPLCGKSKDMLWFQEQGHDVLGVELSPIAVKSFFIENQLPALHQPYRSFTLWECDKIRLLNGDFFKLTSADVQNVTAVYDRAALVALPPEMRRQYVRHMLDVLPTATKILLVCFEYPQDEMSGPPFSVSHEEVIDLYGDVCTWERVRSKDIANKVRFSTSGFVQNVYIMEKQSNPLLQEPPL